MEAARPVGLVGVQPVIWRLESGSGRQIKQGVAEYGVVVFN